MEALMTPTPFLILSDSVTGRSGLGRIARELALRINANMRDVYRVGALGIGGTISCSYNLPFANYSVRDLQGMIPMDLPAVWSDFAGNDETGRSRKGVLCVIWNASWSQAIAQPGGLPDGHPIKDFLLRRPMNMSREEWGALPSKLRAKYADYPFRRWLYCPVDGHCPDGTIGFQLAPIISGFDRVLAYTKYGADVLTKTLATWGEPPKEIEHLPHGIEKVFYPRDRALARQTFISRVSNGASALPLMDDMVLLCIVGTNTPRKDWGIGFETVAELKRRGMNVFLWGHTDQAQAHWDIPAMVRQFGLEGRVILTTENLTDEVMAWAYSACDCQLLIGAGEGWGLCGPEAMACGLPLVHGAYAGGTDYVPREWQIAEGGHFLEGRYVMQRPVFGADVWANRVEAVLCDELRQQRALQAAEPYRWENIWPGWQKWLRNE